jgi:hypothetical protein
MPQGGGQHAQLPRRRADIPPRPHISQAFLPCRSWWILPYPVLRGMFSPSGSHAALPQPLVRCVSGGAAVLYEARSSAGVRGRTPEVSVHKRAPGIPICRTRPAVGGAWHSWSGCAHAMLGIGICSAHRQGTRPRRGGGSARAAWRWTAFSRRDMVRVPGATRGADEPRAR